MFPNNCPGNQKIPLTKAAFFKKGVLTTFWPKIIFFCFQSNIDQTWSDFSTHEYCNLTKFGQD